MYISQEKRQYRSNHPVLLQKSSLAQVQKSSLAQVQKSSLALFQKSRQSLVVLLAVDHISDIRALASSALLAEFESVLVLPFLEEVLGPDHVAAQLSVDTLPEN